MMIFRLMFAVLDQHLSESILCDVTFFPALPRTYRQHGLCRTSRHRPRLERQLNRQSTV